MHRTDEGALAAAHHAQAQIPASRKAFATGWCKWFGVTIATTSMPSSRAASFAAISWKLP